MRCFSCEKISLSAVCKECKEEFFTPKIIKKEIGNLDVVSFFDYYTIVDFIKSKYYFSGYRIYNFIAKEFVSPFLASYSKSYNSKKPIYLIGVDERVSRGYSNVSILMRYGTKGSNIKCLYNVLKAKSSVKYAGKTLDFRLKHPRNFIYTGPRNIDAILIDDIVTTGTTIEEAHRVLKKSGVNLLFALSVANTLDNIDENELEINEKFLE